MMSGRGGGRLVDPLKVISRQHDSLITGLLPFLKQAFSPGPSENVSPNRTDVLLLQQDVDLRKPKKILDLASGNWLVLEKLLQDHPDDHQARCTYVSVDVSRSTSDGRWNELRGKCCPRCFPRPKHIQLNIFDVDAMSKALRRHGQFNLIYLGNILHETPPLTAVRLLEWVFGALVPDGDMIIMDPDWKWCFSDQAWAVRDFASLKVEWETDAIWHTRAGIKSILKAMGFSAHTNTANRGSDFWTAKGSPTAEPPDDQLAKGVKAFSRTINAQRDIELKRIIERRVRLRNDFGRARRFTPELFMRTLAYFTACASQSRRLEALSELEEIS